jgi:hypothetical protein
MSTINISGDNVSVSITPEKEAVTLCFTMESVKVSDEDLDLTVQELAEKYQDELGLDASKVNSYRVGNRVVSADYVPEAGDTVRLAITSESKATI